MAQSQMEGNTVQGGSESAGRDGVQCSNDLWGKE